MTSEGTPQKIDWGVEPNYQRLFVAMLFANVSIFIAAVGFYSYTLTELTGPLILGTIALLFAAMLYYLMVSLVLIYYILLYTGKFGRWIKTVYTTHKRVVEIVGASLLLVVFFVAAFPVVSFLLGREQAINAYVVVILGGAFGLFVAWLFRQNNPSPTPVASGASPIVPNKAKIAPAESLKTKKPGRGMAYTMKDGKLIVTPILQRRGRRVK